MERKTTMKWSNTVETIIEVEQIGRKAQWRIGDAIIKDVKEAGLLQKSDAQCDRHTGIKNSVFTECAEALAAKGVESIKGNEYSGSHVRRLFETAYAFDRDERNSKISWECHRIAGTPANFKKAVATLRKLGKTISHYHVRDLISHWEAEAKAKRSKKKTEATAKKKKAKVEKKKVTEELLKTDPQDVAAREALTKRREELQQVIDDATKDIRENSGTPPTTDLDVDTDDVGALERWAVYLTITQHTMRMKAEAKKMLADVAKISKLLTNSEQQTIADGCNGVIEILDEINELVKRPKPKLSVVGR
jgi:hypothetical protein